MKLLTLEAVLNVIERVEQILHAATEPSPDQRYAIDYTLECIRSVISEEYEAEPGEQK